MKVLFSGARPVRIRGILAAALLAAAVLAAQGCVIVERKTVRYIRYTVNHGDSLKSISTRFQVTVNEIFEINDLKEPIRLKVGQKLRVPYHGQKLQKPDQESLKKTLVTKPAPKESSVKQVNLSTAKGYRGKLLWPIKGEGKISSPFGRRWFSFHEGIDVSEAEGTPILAAHDGVIVYSGSRLRGYGNLVVVRGEAILTVYGHNRRNRVKVGQKVKKGDHIADLGSTGKSSGPHLHFETRIRDAKNKNVAVDPMAFFR